MICVIALIVFGLLGLFSAKYRTIAKEAFDCVFRKLTLRKCDSRLDSRLKAEISGKLMRHWKAGGQFLYRYFEWFSWFFLLLTLVTLFFMGQGIYNYAVYGNCNGPGSTDFCIFDPLGTNTAANTTGPPDQSDAEVCAVPAHLRGKPLVAPPASVALEAIQHGLYAGSPRATVTIVEFGCFSCHYTKKVEPTVQRIISHYGDAILYVYRDFPLTTSHPTALLAAEASHCALDQGTYWQYRERLFENQDKQARADLVAYAQELGLDETAFASCLDDTVHEPHVQAATDEGLAAGIAVTPTFFINNQTIVGAKSYKEFRSVIDQELGRTSFWHRLAFWN